MHFLCSNTSSYCDVPAAYSAHGCRSRVSIAGKHGCAPHRSRRKKETGKAVEAHKLTMIYTPLYEIVISRSVRALEKVRYCIRGMEASRPHQKGHLCTQGREDSKFLRTFKQRLETASKAYLGSSSQPVVKLHYTQPDPNPCLHTEADDEHAYSIRVISPA